MKLKYHTAAFESLVKKKKKTFIVDVRVVIMFTGDKYTSLSIIIGVVQVITWLACVIDQLHTAENYSLINVWTSEF